MSRETDHSSPGAVARLLESARREIRLIAGLRGGSLTAAIASAIVFGSFLVDRLFRLGVPARALLLMVYAGTLAWGIWRFLLRPLRHGLTDRELADVVERERPDFGDRVRSAVDFVRDEKVARPAIDAGTEDLEVALKRSVVADAARLCDEAGELRVTDHRALGRSALAGAACLLVVVTTFGLASPGTPGLWFRRNVLLGSEEWPYRTMLRVAGFEDGRVGVPRGDPLVVDIDVIGEEISRAWIDVDYGRDDRRYALTSTGPRSFRYNHPEVREPFLFEVRGGDYRSPPFEVVVLERPGLETLTITRVFPSYMEREPEVVDGSVGEHSIPVGTELRFEARSTKPLEQAAIVAGDRSVPFEIDAADRQRLAGAFLPERSETLTIDFVDVEGVRPDTPNTIAVRLVPDRPPTIRLRATGIGSMVSVGARIPLRLEARDDHRVETLELVSELGPRLDTVIAGPPPENGGQGTDTPADGGDAAAGDAGEGDVIANTRETRHELPSFEPDDLVVLTHDFEVADLATEPERRLALSVVAVDNDTLNGPNAGRSNVLEFLVVTDQKLLDDFLRRQEDQRQAFERLVESEQKIRDALYDAVDGSLRAEGPLEEAASNELASHSRQERTIANQVVSIAAAVEGILTEMKNNRIGEADDIERIGAMVVFPLRELAAEDLPALAARLESLRAEPQPETRTVAGLELAEDVEAVIEKMHAILANMIKLESFSEIVNMLRQVINLNREAEAQTKKALERLLNEDVFEDDG